MALANMQVYDNEIYTTTIELLGQRLEAFNAASGGAIVLNTNAWRGNYTKEAFFQTLAGAQRRVDRTAAITTQAATDLAQGEIVGVKVAGGFGQVGRSSMLLSTPESKILVDCGINPGARSPMDAFPRLDSLNITLDELDAIVIGHAHLDHTGFLPTLFHIKVPFVPISSQPLDLSLRR